jgi:hypothetical protein
VVGPFTVSFASRESLSHGELVSAAAAAYGMPDSVPRTSPETDKRRQGVVDASRSALAVALLASLGVASDAFDADASEAVFCELCDPHPPHPPRKTADARIARRAIDI